MIICNFCGREESQVDIMIANDSYTSHICDKCVQGSVVLITKIALQRKIKKEEQEIWKWR